MDGLTVEVDRFARLVAPVCCTCRFVVVLCLVVVFVVVFVVVPVVVVFVVCWLLNVPGCASEQEGLTVEVGGLASGASASRTEDPGFESSWRRDFFEVESYQ